MASLADNITAVVIAIRNKLNTKAPIASPVFTGTPIAPTQAAGDSSTRIATTAFVASAVANVGVIRACFVSCAGAPNGNEMIGSGIVPADFTINPAACAFYAETPATAQVVITVKRNGSPVGTVTFAAGGTTGAVAFTSPALTKGDKITFVNQATADATLADLTGFLSS